MSYNYSEEMRWKKLLECLTDISVSLRILSSRMEQPEEHETKKETYSDKYFARSK